MHEVRPIRWLKYYWAMEALLWQLPSCKVSFAKCSATVLARSLIGYQVLKVTKSLNACIMFAALLNVNRSSIAVVVCRFARAKPTIEWNRGPRRRKKTTDVYLGKRLPCFYHFDWIFKLAVKWPSMCEKMVFLLKVQFVWSWMPVKYVELLIEYTQAWIYEMHAHY